MEFHFFVCSFCRVGQGAKTNKRENEKWNFIFSFVRFAALYKSPKRRNGFHFFVCSFCRLPHSTMERQNDKVTAKYQSLICRGYLFVLSFVRFVDFHKAPKTTERQRDKMRFCGHFVLSFVRFVALYKSPKRRNEISFWRFFAFCRLP